MLNMVVVASWCVANFKNQQQGNWTELMMDGGKYWVIINENMFEAAALEFEVKVYVTA